MITGPVSKKLKSSRPRPGSIEKTYQDRDQRKKTTGIGTKGKKLPGPGPGQRTRLHLPGLRPGPMEIKLPGPDRDRD